MERADEKEGELCSKYEKEDYEDDDEKYNVNDTNDNDDSDKTKYPSLAECRTLSYFGKRACVRLNSKLCTYTWLKIQLLCTEFSLK